MWRRSVIVGVALWMAACGQHDPQSLQNSNTSSASAEIVNGNLVYDNDSISHHIVAVMSNKGDQGIGICTGTLIAIGTVLTAAHCVNDVVKEQVSLVFHKRALDQYRWSLKFPGMVQSVRAVKSVEYHPQYNPQTLENDIAIIKFDGVPPIQYYPAPLLTDTSEIYQSTQVLLAGYGTTSHDGPNEAGILRQGFAYVIDSFKPMYVLLDQTSGHGLCQGDSGGPAFVYVNGEYKYWGIISSINFESESSVDACEQHSRVTRLSAFNSWVIMHMPLWH